MVDHAVTMDGIFHALAHSARREMIDKLAGKERTISELAAPFAMSLAAASKHVRVLESAGLVDRTVVGRQHVCRLVPQPLQQATVWLNYYDRFWTDRLDGLDTFLRSSPDSTEGPA
ncbi:MAG TPA: metalloregulator ArsR/SmtB family transcription factor [Mycobacteriales bacterium]|jgi:DNA-binding transcriptional ArsR family regulator|nr:metalloregulator ArsR/SmtB family transcription factor [Mycobacteriales bacterium]